jgi:hypothetical protein
MAGVLVPYDRFLEIRLRRLRVADAIEGLPTANPQPAVDRPAGDTGDARVPVEGGKITHD